MKDYEAKRILEIMEAFAWKAGIPLPPDMRGLPGRFGAQAMPDDATDRGVGKGGAVVLTPSAPSNQVVQTLFRPEGLSGMASVHVSVIDASQVDAAMVTSAAYAPGTTVTPPTAIPKPTVKLNQRVILDVTWQTGNGGGYAQVDATQGSMFTVAGATTISVKATLMARDGFSPPTNTDLLSAKKVEVAVQWGSTISRPAYMTSPVVHLAGAESGPIDIPPQASSVVLLCDDTTAVLTAKLRTRLSNAGTFDVVAVAEYARNAIWDSRLPICQGAEQFTMASTINPTNAFALFELWL